MPPLPHRYILGTRVDATSDGDAVSRILQWARVGESSFVWACGVHGVMEDHDSRDFH
jgi:N-acetylglucosaminyldiphosphoundecaprenol N-acetyl-beta-D-mannosaminyltransferase